jgi:hypothetical protein
MKQPARSKTVRKLAKELGFDAVVAGPLKLARQLEQLAWLWIYLAHKQGLGVDIALRLVRRESTPTPAIPSQERPVIQKARRFT